MSKHRDAEIHALREFVLILAHLQLARMDNFGVTFWQEQLRQVTARMEAKGPILPVVEKV